MIRDSSSDPAPISVDQTRLRAIVAGAWETLRVAEPPNCGQSLAPDDAEGIRAEALARRASSAELSRRAIRSPAG